MVEVRVEGDFVALLNEGLKLLAERPEKVVVFSRGRKDVAVGLLVPGPDAVGRNPKLADLVLGEVIFQLVLVSRTHGVTPQDSGQVGTYRNRSAQRCASAIAGLPPVYTDHPLCTCLMSSTGRSRR